MEVFGSDDFPDFMLVIFRFQPLIFREPFLPLATEKRQKRRVQEGQIKGKIAMLFDCLFFSDLKTVFLENKLPRIYMNVNSNINHRCYHPPKWYTYLFKLFLVVAFVLGWG